MKSFRMTIRSFRDAFKSVVRNFSLSLASITCITITLIIIAASFFTLSPLIPITCLLHFHKNKKRHYNKYTNRKLSLYTIRKYPLGYFLIMHVFSFHTVIMIASMTIHGVYIITYLL